MLGWMTPVLYNACRFAKAVQVRRLICAQKASLHATENFLGALVAKGLLPKKEDQQARSLMLALSQVIESTPLDYPVPEKREGTSRGEMPDPLLAEGA